MSLANQTCWVVGGVGVVGRGITRGLLQAGATVIVNSRSEERLETLCKGLGHPDKLIAVHGSLLPGHAPRTVAQTLLGMNKNQGLQHVISHGAVRWWAKPTPGHYDYYEYKAGCDETYSLNIRGNSNLLDMNPEEFITSSAQLASLHFSAAKELVPLLSTSPDGSTSPTYTFVTGDGSGKPDGKRTAMGEINSHHVWGLSAALREELSSAAASVSGTEGQGAQILCREIRVGLPVQELSDSSHISEDIGDLCAGLAASSSSGHHEDDNGRLLKIENETQLESYMAEYNVSRDANVGDLPHHACE
mmetsp:Transcript_5949/g.8412  ORF Transcript_5949/g.8412 Transcript_5949/m.8412 type:complete len:304 (+) Transcript_5949:100-1011(+)